MNFEQLKQRVERAEFLMEERTRRTHAAWDTVRLEWRSAWTPGRIVGVGLVAGFIAGRASPGPAVKRLRAAAGPQMLQWVTTFSGLTASVQAAFAAMTAKGAARTADAAADTAEQAADTVEGAAGSTATAPMPRPQRQHVPDTRDAANQPRAAATAVPVAHAPATAVAPPAAAAAAAYVRTVRPSPHGAAPDATSPPLPSDGRALPPSDRRWQPDPAYDRAPRPAEAATDVSEDRWPPPGRGDLR